jgi:phage terminase small subunit
MGEYLLDLNATRAAIRAGYSVRSARKIGSENLTKLDIEIRKAIEARAERTRVDQDKVVKELAKLAFSDWRELGSWGDAGMTLKSSSKLTDEAAACVKDVSHTTERRFYGDEMVENLHTKLSLHDKKAALELLGRHLGMFKDNLNVSSDRPFEIRVRGLTDVPCKLHLNPQESRWG